jgi:hypothetical protein
MYLKFDNCGIVSLFILQSEKIEKSPLEQTIPVFLPQQLQHQLTVASQLVPIPSVQLQYIFNVALICRVFIFPQPPFDRLRLFEFVVFRTYLLPTLIFSYSISVSQHLQMFTSGHGRLGGAGYKFILNEFRQHKLLPFAFPLQFFQDKVRPIERDLLGFGGAEQQRLPIRIDGLPPFSILFLVVLTFNPLFQPIVDRHRLSVVPFFFPGGGRHRSGNSRG